MSRRCRQGRLVLPFVDGELATDEALRFEEHCADCASCRAAVDAQRALEEALVALPQPRLLLPDRARLQQQIARRIDAAAAAPAPARRPLLLQWRVVAAGLAAAAVIVGLRLFLTKPARPPSAPPQLVGAAMANEPADAAEPAPVTEPVVELVASFDGPPTNWAQLSAARDEVARILRGLGSESGRRANGDLLSSFVAATQSLRAAGVSLPTVLLQVLKDPDPTLACAAADLFARAAVNGELGRDDQTLVPRLEAVMKRPDRGAAMVPTLVAIGTPRAWDALLRACQMAHLRPLALRALVAKGPPAVTAAVATQLTAALREPAGRELVAASLSALAVSRPDQIRLLAGLARAGAPAAPLAEALQRGGAPAIALIASGLADRSIATRRDALLLAPLVPPRASEPLVAPLAALVAVAPRSEEAAAALAELARIGGTGALAALVQAAGEPSLANSRAREIAGAFASALGATTDVAAALAAVRAALPDSDALLVELCRVARGPQGAAARAALLGDPTVATGPRAVIALEVATRREKIGGARLIELLDGTHRTGDDGLTAALLVLLYDADGADGLARGVVALGLDLPKQRLDRLRDAARSVLRGLDGRRDLARVDALLRLAP